ncbi:ATP-binding cassette domain-containing protein [Pectobacteriaceae bacterium C111]|nr:ATP-binding cassette domain-containing protein [Pectobacteriaceae bacterium C111]
MNNTPVLETQGLGKRFGGIQVIHQVDIRIRQGEVRCVIGPNGAGKSTFFKLLTGEHAPSSGEIRFQGERLNALPPFSAHSSGHEHQISDPRHLCGSQRSAASATVVESSACKAPPVR